MNPHDLGSDIDAVRAALMRLRDNDDELLRHDHPPSSRAKHLPIRRTLVTELIDFLDAREDIIDLQVRNGLDPLKLLFSEEKEL